MNEKVVVIDGGFATQLSVHVGARVDGDPLWSARFNATDPNAVVETHLDFLRDGADAILTNTYQASVEGYTEYLNLSEEESIDLIKKTVALAQLAREKYLYEAEENNIKIDISDIPWIIGSIGPYGAHLHDGSEYTGSYADYVTPEIIKKWHRVRMDAIIEENIDALAIETIPCEMEALALLDIMADEYPDIKFWISFQCKVDGSSIAHGENFTETIHKIWDIVKQRKINNCIALGVNCLHPQYVTQLLKPINANLEKYKKIPLVVYPNSGEIYDVKTGWGGKEDCIPLETYVPEWIKLGAKIIGGCCRTYSRDIKRIKNAINALK